MTVFLSSSPCVYLAPRAIINPENSFLDQLKLALPMKPRCLFICSAPDDYGFTDRVSQEMAAAFLEAGIPFSDLSTLDRRNQKSAQSLIWNSDFIILSGGHVPTQNAFFQEIGLKKLLKDYQGVILGISAGSMNCAETVYAQPEEAGESSPDFVRFMPGLGFTPVQILPHYQQVKDYYLDGLRLYEDITRADSMGHCFHIFPDGTYLLIQDGSQRIFGECWRLQNGHMKQVCRKGESIRIL